MFVLKPLLKSGFSFVLTTLPLGFSLSFVLLRRYELAFTLSFGNYGQIYAALQCLYFACEELVFEEW